MLNLGVVCCKKKCDLVMKPHKRFVKTELQAIVMNHSQVGSQTYVYVRMHLLWLCGCRNLSFMTKGFTKCRELFVTSSQCFLCSVLYMYSALGKDCGEVLICTKYCTVYTTVLAVPQRVADPLKVGYHEFSERVPDSGLPQLMFYPLWF